MRSVRSSIDPTHHSVASDCADAELAYYYCIDCCWTVVAVDAQSDIGLAARCESFAFERTRRVGLASFGDDFVAVAVECSAGESFAASAFDSDARKSHSD